MKDTGSIYLHCDPTASHYLKLLMDAVFGPNLYLNEMTWKRSSAHSDTRQGMRRAGKLDFVHLGGVGEDVGELSVNCDWGFSAVGFQPSALYNQAA